MTDEEIQIAEYAERREVNRLADAEFQKYLALPGVKLSPHEELLCRSSFRLGGVVDEKGD